MPNANDILITTLRRPHLEWGSHRHTDSRPIIYGEGYLQIPLSEARRLNITNRNHNGNVNYTCSSSDGFLNDAQLIASVSTSAGNIYAKQFHGKGNLKILGSWFNHINAQIGDRVEIKWINPTKIIITKL